MTLHTKCEEHQLTILQDIIMFLKIVQFSSSSHCFKRTTLSQSSHTSCKSIFFKFGTPIRHFVAYLGLKFEMFLREL